MQICVFPQEGLLNDPGAEELLVAACEQGADVIGGCPYTDTDPLEQIARIFGSRAASISTSIFIWISTSTRRGCTSTRCAGKPTPIARAAASRSVTSPSFRPSMHRRLAEIGRRLADAGVAVTVLPATDLFLMGRDRRAHVPRGVAPAHRLLGHGVTCSLATNNVLNPFTPFGDCSLIRMANLYANIAQIGRRATCTPASPWSRPAGATDQCGGLRHRGRPSRRPVVLDSRDRPWRWPSSRNLARHQARPPQLHPRRGDDPSPRPSSEGLLVISAIAVFLGN